MDGSVTAASVPRVRNAMTLSVPSTTTAPARRLRIVVVVNPVAGAGRAVAVSRGVVDALRGAGHETQVFETSRDPAQPWLEPALAGAALLVVVGGDGAVRRVLDAAIHAAVPLYQVPCGTENLFARELGMDLRPRTLLAAIDRWTVREMDVATANDETFVLMASVGFDADVVHDLAPRRRGAISRGSYLRPVLRQLRRWKPPRLAVTVDGRRIDDGGTGFAIVANSRHYGARLDPTGEASVDDGLLDVAWFPCGSRLELLAWVARFWLRRQRAGGRMARALGRRIEIACSTPQHYQVDGDTPLRDDRPPETPRSPTTALRIAVRPRALRVLQPQLVTDAASRPRSRRGARGRERLQSGGYGSARSP